MKTPRHRSLLKLFALATAGALATLVTLAQPLPAAPPGAAQAAIEQFLQGQTVDLPGQVLIRFDSPQLQELPPCDALEPFLPGGARLWGRVSVGLRCLAGPPWTRYVPVYIAVIGRYYVAARQIDYGEALQPADLSAREGDLASLPGGVVLDAAQLEGMKAGSRIAPGAPIRREWLRGALLIQQGQNVKVVSRGAGFVVSTEGKAMSSGAAGAIVQVKIAGGQLLSGKVGANGVVERSQ